MLWSKRLVVPAFVLGLLPGCSVGPGGSTGFGSGGTDGDSTGIGGDSTSGSGGTGGE